MKPTQIRIWLFSSLLTIFSIPAVAQTNISGIINSYSAVTAVNTGSNAVTVTNSAGFAAGNRALLIQMKGATIDETNTSSYGTITNLNEAGNYELLTVCSVSGNDIDFQHTLLNSYDPTGLVQLVRVPVYANALITGGDLQAMPWNGSIGGVLAMEVTGTLDFGTQNMDLSGSGFLGGAAVESGAGCSFILDNSYFQPLSGADTKGLKGEGIAAAIANKECGRGPQANGGGGGNNHNAGGGGGGNLGAGGAGGQRIKSGTFNCGSNPGVTGPALAYSNAANKIYIGGGGGAGHGNNAGIVGEEGQNGGGIVLIRAGTLVGNGQTINASGIAQTTNTLNEGAGGGGAGGAVLLEVGAFSGVVNVDVSGGRGGNTDNTGTSNCNGPGGGGGGGAIWVNGGAVPAAILPNLAGGAAGVIASNGQGNCTNGNSNNGEPGLTGATRTGLVIPESSTNFAGCVVMGTELKAWNGITTLAGNVLTWTTEQEWNNHYFDLQHSTNGTDFYFLGQIKGKGNSETPQSYQWLHATTDGETHFYRLRQVDFDGTSALSGTIEISHRPNATPPITLYPNPIQQGESLHLKLADPQETLIDMAIYDLLGNQVMVSDPSPDHSQNKMVLVPHLAPGLYYIKVRLGSGQVPHLPLLIQ